MDQLAEMRKSLIFAFLLITATAAAQAPAENYPDDPASVEHLGVPKGEILKFTFENSKIFPGTWREYWIYVPAQYKADKPACVYVGQDGIALKAPTVFDNLISQGEMPVTIGIFINPGRLRAENDQLALDRFNRSLEYDGLGDAYARFLLQEILPDAEKQKTSDGRPIRLSKSGNNRAIGGTSSGAICAFTAAWEHPEEFSRVFSGIGTYVGLRGGDRYPNLIRKTEPKPIRVFLQDGANDNNSYAGDWWMANQMMERSLAFSGYEVNHVWGEGGHNGKHPTAVFPAAMKWLWKDHPKPIAAGASSNALLKALLIPGEDWKEVANGQGNPVMRSFVTTHTGNSYVISSAKSKDPGIYLARPGKKKVVADTGIRYPAGLALTPDQTQLYVTESASHWVWIFRISPDGTLAHKQRYGWLYEPDTGENPSSGDIMCDREGRVYAATAMGIQVLDQTGRVNAILPLPGSKPDDLRFGGPNSDILYVRCGDRVYSRKLATKGVNPAESPIKPEKPRL